jgi:hypothetical protein
VEWSNLNPGTLAKILTECGYIPPMFQEMDIEEIIQNDREKLMTMIYYRKMHYYYFEQRHIDPP